MVERVYDLQPNGTSPVFQLAWGVAISSQSRQSARIELEYS